MRLCRHLISRYYDGWGGLSNCFLWRLTLYWDTLGTGIPRKTGKKKPGKNENLKNEKKKVYKKKKKITELLRSTFARKVARISIANHVLLEMISNVCGETY